MKAEFLNPFVYAGMKVLGEEAGLKKWVPDKPILIRVDGTRNAVNVVVGVVGRVQGIVMYGFSLSFAKGVIRTIAGADIPIVDPMATSALGELGNQITGLAAGILGESGYPCGISPPSIVKGTAIRFTLVSLPMVVVPIATELGQLHIHLTLKEMDTSQGA
jgi:chemotaxis protein CheX